MHFDPKKYIKNYKMRLIQNEKDMISYYQLKKNGKKRGEAQKLGHRYKMCAKISPK